MIALALGLIATAVIGAGMADLKLARAEMRQTRVETGLASAHAAAIGPLLIQSPSRRLRWPATSDLGAVEVLAEAESSKLALVSAVDLDDADLARFGVADPEKLRARLRSLAVGKAPEALALGDLDVAQLWRACAGSMISPYGRGKALQLTATGSPGGGQAAALAGEVWRVRVEAPGGWSEERLVRLTGDENRPAAILERRLSRTTSGGEPCADLIG